MLAGIAAVLCAAVGLSFGCGGGGDPQADVSEGPVAGRQPSSSTYDNKTAVPTLPPPPPWSVPPPDPHLVLHPFITRDIDAFTTFLGVPVGADIAVSEDREGSAVFWHAIGFEAIRKNVSRRSVDLLSPPGELVYSRRSGLQNIDCFAIISVDRRAGAEPYLFATLRSLFASVDGPIEVNILLSNADAEFVSAARLQRALGADIAAHVHVLPAPAPEAAFVEAHLSPGRRGGWNYCRALRAYAGEKGLLLMEDDIVISLDGIRALDLQLSIQPLAAVSLFNFHCERISPDFDFETSSLWFQEVPPDWHFYCSQAIYYRPHLTAPISRYIQLRMAQENHDNLIGEFFTDYGLVMGYTAPSLVQHVGRASIYGSSSFLESHCFRPSIAQTSAAKRAED